MTSPGASNRFSAFRRSYNDERMKQRKPDAAAGCLIRTSKKWPLQSQTAWRRLKPNLPLRPHMNRFSPTFITSHSARDGFSVQTSIPSRQPAQISKSVSLSSRKPLAMRRCSASSFGCVHTLSLVHCMREWHQSLSTHPHRSKQGRVGYHTTKIYSNFLWTTKSSFQLEVMSL